MIPAILGGGLLLLWPALLNGYPLVFIDTHAYLAQTIVPRMAWDKPWVYGPFLHLGHWQLTLWCWRRLCKCCCCPGCCGLCNVSRLGR